MRWAVVAVAVLLAGCSDSAAPTRDAVPQATKDVDLGAPDGSAGKQSTGGGTGRDGNKRPLLTLAADVTSGDGPLHVAFTIKGLDDDGDALRWRLDADGDGAMDGQGDLDKQSKTAFTYRVKGEYRATAWLSDGRDEVSANVTIVVLSSEPVQTEEADLLLQAEGCFVPEAYAATGTIPGATGSAAGGLSRLHFRVHPDSIGRPFTATWTFDVGYLYMAWFFVDAAGAILASDRDDAPNFGNYQQEGTVPDRAAFGVFFACGGPTGAHVEYVA